MEVVRENALTDETAAERVDCEKGRQLRDDGPTARGERRAFRGAGGRFDLSRQAGVERGADESGDHVAEEERRISDVVRKAREEGPGRRRSVSDQVIHAEGEGPAIGTRGLREDRLFERQKRPDFSRSDGHVPDDARQDWGPPIPRDEEQGSRDEIGEREEDERFLPANSIREEANDERVEGAAEHGRGQDNSDRDGSEAQLGEVDAEDYSEETVGSRSDGLLEEDEFAVPIDPVSEPRRSHRAQHRCFETLRAAKT